MRICERTPEELVCAEGFQDCACGRAHVCRMDYLKIGRGAVRFVPEMVRALGAKHPFVICDPNTYQAAGEKVCEILKEAGIPYHLYSLKEDRPAPDEKSVGAVVMHLKPEDDLILAVGSGVINDVGKVVAYTAHLKEAVVGTAPSMDGYASSNASMEIDNVKTSLYVNAPDGILLDSEILAKAPMRMLWAGFGDMIAKYTGVLEWRIAHLVTGEYYCEEVAELMRRATNKVVDSADGILNRDPDAAQAIAEGLVLSGIAMSFAKISRPASGLEHSISHMWEMMALDRKRPYDLHGIQVGVGTLLNLEIFEKLKGIVPDQKRAEEAISGFSSEEWESEVRRIFGLTAAEILEVEKRAGKNDPVRMKRQMEAVVTHWDEILKMIGEELPPLDRIRSIMVKLGMPMTPKDIGISAEDAADAVTGAREIKDKYMVCNLLSDLGLAKEFREYVYRLSE